jgi:formate hydrogenlyase subunit 4
MNEFVEVIIRLGAGGLVMIAVLIISLVLKGFDRRFAAWLQARVGPPLLQPFYDIAKLWQKENILPERAVNWSFIGAPFLAFVSSLVLVLFVPLGPVTGKIEGWMPILEGYGDLILVVYLLAVPSLMMAIGGFSSGSPLATIGAQREIVMMMSYELPLSVVVLSLGWRLSKLDLGVDPFSMADITSKPLWGEVTILGFLGLLMLAVVFFLIIPSELSKIPFDAPEAETEIGGGILAEYSGNNLAMFYLADAVKTVAFCSLAVALFFPYGISSQVGDLIGTNLSGWAVFGVDLLFWIFKVELVYFFAVTVFRVGAARLRIDRISWLYLVPLSVMSVVGAILLYLDTV